MLDVHLTLSYDINFIKIYRKNGYYVVGMISEQNYDIAKSKSIYSVARNICEMILGYPSVDLLLHHRKGFLKKTDKKKLNILINDSNNKDIEVETIIAYLKFLI